MAFPQETWKTRSYRLRSNAAHVPLLMKYLIVNADDFGLTEGVNRAIREAHQTGLLTSATLMANMPAFADAVGLAHSLPALGVGLHFNITQGHPVADPALVRSLLNEQGEFLGTTTALAKRALTGQLVKREIATELRAQIEKAHAAGISLTHIDSHKHAHLLPPVFGMVAELASEYGIRAIRLTRERPRLTFNSPKQLKQASVALALARLSQFNAPKLDAVGLHSTDHFLGVAETGFWTQAWLLDKLAHLPAGSTELMCHPGYDDQALGGSQTRLRASRQVELQCLTDPAVIAAVRQHQVELRHFGQLATPSRPVEGHL